MSKFIEVFIREHVEGTPGFMDKRDFLVNINVDHVTLFNKGEDSEVTFVRLACGATICVVASPEEFAQLIEAALNTNVNIVPLISMEKKEDNE